ncbi:tripartite tricarboxylate transporter substrate-binding protein [Modestobacter marinus]|uniref:C4-dicarboxylate ABC transporter substrate-binding protein n=1 Tax=Modestobacter marinus TaxID=477641 RepID=A0A846LC69_9ACTN|nr:tripartite tricarboxylate transporter substrate-binding protein [Modestobacter marinus]NIH65713.1 putative tricarboxylic transport membrane protein [Modestobacter marinus]GGL66473.1 C4-dicarboxylate ABC transporter substrate-binding protein [Modestobacter marinus]
MSRTTSARPRSAARHWRLTAAAGAALLGLLTGCSDSGGGEAGAEASVGRLEMMAPADPGGGWDSTARALAASIEEAGLASSTQVTNVGGAGGTVGLAELANERSEEFLMVMGLVMLGAIETNQSQATLEDTTPIARLTAEDEVVVVPADSPYTDVQDLVDDMKANGRSVSIAGGSAGGTDHILAGLIAQAGDVPIENLNYVAYSGGGESLAALLGSQVSAGISGVSEYAEQIEAGELRALAVSGSERVEGIDAPTLTEAGLDVELSNWRGVVGPPDLSPEARQTLIDLVDEAVQSEAWQERLETNGWEDTYLSGDEFDAFLEEEQQRVQGVLQDIGLVE